MAEKTVARTGAISLTRPVTLLRHLGYVVRSMRPKQWTKNGIVGMAFLFSINDAWTLDDVDSWLTLALRAAAAAVIFCHNHPSGVMWTSALCVGGAVPPTERLVQMAT